jgi:exonuclease SbcC
MTPARIHLRRAMVASGSSIVEIISSVRVGRNPHVYNDRGMIPVHLSMRGFLSYRDETELDFRLFDLACISGRNGAGKSALLDAITFALFGQARRRDDALLNSQAASAEVTFIFEYEGNTYRVQRAIPRGKPTVLEFQVRGAEEWRPLTERTVRGTQGRIEDILRLDYDTFVNASFFLQGQADLFTQQNAGRRKEILGNILGLEVWEEYRSRASERRKGLEGTLSQVAGRLSEIDAELGEEAERRRKLDELSASLLQVEAARTTQERILENLRRAAAALEEQRKLAATQLANMDAAQDRLAALRERLTEKENELVRRAALLARRDEIMAAHEQWTRARRVLEELDRLAADFIELGRRRAPLLQRIAAEGARLEEERRSLHARAQEIEGKRLAAAALSADHRSAQKTLEHLTASVAGRADLEASLSEARSRHGELNAQNARLKADMEDLKLRVDQLEAARGAVCPLCGQRLDAEHKRSTLLGLKQSGKALADTFRANKTELSQVTEAIERQQRTLAKTNALEAQRLEQTAVVSKLEEKLAATGREIQEWQSNAEPRLATVSDALQMENFGLEARAELAALDASSAASGYGATAHDAARREEAQLRAAEDDFRLLATAQEVGSQIDGEVHRLASEIQDRQNELEGLRTQYAALESTLGSEGGGREDLERAEAEVRLLREQENQLRDEVGAARQRVEVLDTLRLRQEEYRTEHERLQLQIADHRTLERAFGREGVPTLLIEQALPQLETKANELLDRLSDGQMSMRFVTQASYKDRKREDRKETLDILISDPSGVRTYEMFSGGEAFRVNFSIRLALSEILARRKGARLQTLVIDEGFGSQDAQGRQRLIEAINLVKPDFAKILVITHLEELKDAFPNRIEVEKSDQGSTLRVV